MFNQLSDGSVSAIESDEEDLGGGRNQLTSTDEMLNTLEEADEPIFRCLVRAAVSHCARMPECPYARMPVCPYTPPPEAHLSVRSMPWSRLYAIRDLSPPYTLYSYDTLTPRAPPIPYTHSLILIALYLCAYDSRRGSAERHTLSLLKC